MTEVVLHSVVGGCAQREKPLVNTVSGCGDKVIHKKLWTTKPRLCINKRRRARIEEKFLKCTTCFGDRGVSSGECLDMR